MTAKVYFSGLRDECLPEEQAEKTAVIFDAAGAGKCIAPEDFVAVKIHVGEKNNRTHVHPSVATAVVGKVKQYQGQPFLTETATLYKGERENAIKHLVHAYRHGFGFEQVGAPFIMADGLAGSTEVEVEINGELNRSVRIAREIRVADAIMVISHPTGHMITALGACIKNLGMGLASRMGKMRQHSSMKPKVKSAACRLCRKCLDWCPEGVISANADAVCIDAERCSGCGECLAVCRFGAMEFNWGQDPARVQKEMAEYAYGVIKGKEEKCFYINVLVNMTKDCDCLAEDQSKIMPDMGILGSFDPVAVDKATLDLTEAPAGRNLAETSYCELNAMEQLNHAVKLGMGTLDYEIVKVK